MSEKRRLFYVVLTLVITASSIGIITTYRQYQASLQEKLKFLMFQVESTSALIKAVARFDRNTFKNKQAATNATLQQIEDAFTGDDEFQSDHTILFARKSNAGAEIFLRYEGKVKNPIIIEPEHKFLPLPIRWALEKKTGAGIFIGLSGKEVLAAYTWIDILEIALVIKVQLATIKQPYLKNAASLSFIAIFIMSLAAFLVVRLTEPIIRNLREKEILNRTIVEAAHDALLILDQSGYILLVNPAGCHMFGYQSETLIGRYISILLPPEEKTNKPFYKFLNQNTLMDFTSDQTQARNRNGEIIPVLVAGARKKSEDKEFLVLILHNLTRLQLAEKRVRLLSQRILDIQETERQIISRDIHDVLGSLLVGLKLQVQALLAQLPQTTAQERNEVLANFDEAIEQARNLSALLSPYGLRHLNLNQALEKLISSYASRRYNLQFEYMPPNCEIDLPAADKLQIYRIAQEAIQNAIKHAEAKKITLTLAIENNEIHIIIRDDGKGFNRKEPNNGQGQLIMAERAALIGGRLTVHTQSGQGSEVQLVIPPK